MIIIDIVGFEIFILKDNATLNMIQSKIVAFVLTNSTITK